MNLIQASILIFGFALLNSCRGKPRLNCTTWHVGEYELVDNQRDLHILRTLNEQIETDRITGTYTKFLVKWIDNCTYQLYFLEGDERYLEVWKDNYLEVSILNATESGYAYQAQFSTSDKIENYEITKIK